MKATINDIVPGRVLYNVDCPDGHRAHTAKLVCKVIVTGKPVIGNSYGSKKFDCIQDYRPYGFDWYRPDTYDFVRDVGIGDSVYNLHRLFCSEADALAYVAECHAGKFSDPIDQEYYDRTSTAAYKKQWEAERDDLYAMSDALSFDFDD